MKRLLHLFLISAILFLVQSCKRCIHCEYLDDTGGIYYEVDFCSTSKNELKDFKTNYEKEFRGFGMSVCRDK
jgi:hypothetical protein